MLTKLGITSHDPHHMKTNKQTNVRNKNNSHTEKFMKKCSGT